MRDPPPARVLHEISSECNYRSLFHRNKQEFRDKRDGARNIVELLKYYLMRIEERDIV